MALRLRQVGLVAKDLEPALESLCAVFAIEVSLRDPGVSVFALVNGVMPMGDTFLEVVSPTHHSASAARFLERRGGDGGYMVVFQSDDLGADRDRLSDLGVEIAWEGTLEDAAAVHIDPRSVGGAIVSIDAMDPYESWRWAGPTWRERVRTERVRAIRGVTLQAADPARLAVRWSEVLGYPLDHRRNRITFEDDSHVTFVAAADARGDGVQSIHLSTNDRTAIVDAARQRGARMESDYAIELCGTRFELS